MDAPLDGEPHLVLVVNDNPRQAVAWANALRHNAYAVVTHTGAQTALRWAERSVREADALCLSMEAGGELALAARLLAQWPFLTVTLCRREAPGAALAAKAGIVRVISAPVAVERVVNARGQILCAPGGLLIPE